MNRRKLIHVMAALPIVAAWPARASSAAQVQVYKNPSCECCTGWVKHLQSAGFAVKVTETDDTLAVRQRLGMPDRFGSCHTAVVEGYAIEGHVPAAEIQRLLRERPPAIGLTVPGMPVGSPGMEYGDRKDAYDVLLIDRRGRERVYASYGKPAVR